MVFEIELCGDVIEFNDDMEDLGVEYIDFSDLSDEVSGESVGSELLDDVVGS